MVLSSRSLCFVLVLASSSVWAQTTAPATNRVARAKAQDKIRHVWVATPDAPPEIRTWVATFPALKERELDRIKTQIETTKEERQQVVKRPIGKVPKRNALGGTSYVTDQKDVKRQRDELKRLDLEIQSLWKEFRAIEQDSLWFPPEPTLVARIGSFGNIGGVEVFQIVDTTGMIDGQTAMFADPVKIVGTKRYQTAFGSMTVYELEPFNYMKFIEVQQVDAADAIGGGKAR